MKSWTQYTETLYTRSCVTEEEADYTGKARSSGAKG